MKAQAVLAQTHGLRSFLGRLTENYEYVLTDTGTRFVCLACLRKVAPDMCVVCILLPLSKSRHQLRALLDHQSQYTSREKRIVSAAAVALGRRVFENGLHCALQTGCCVCSWISV